MSFIESSSGKVLLLAILILVLVGTGLMYYPIQHESFIVLPEDQRIINQILKESGDDLRLRFVSQVKFTKVEIMSETDKDFYFTAYIFFGIPYTQARVFYRSGQITGGEVVSARKDFGTN